MAESELDILCKCVPLVLFLQWCLCIGQKRTVTGYAGVGRVVQTFHRHKESTWDRKFMWVCD